MQIDDTDIRVDSFGSGGEVYFLTHFHSDHLSGLRKGWRCGPLYCSGLTAKLLRERYGLDGNVLRVIEAGESRRVRVNGTGVAVTAVGANHCPGAVMFHFGFPKRRVLYTGDFRIDDDIRREVRRLAGVDLAYVDATYDDPRYVFPPQSESIDRVLELVAEHMDREVFLAVYNIGKTKLIGAVWEKFGLPVYVSEPMGKLYEAMGLGELVTRELSVTNLRGYHRGYYYTYFRWRHRRHRRTHTVIIPTGWAADVKDDPHGYLYVPYSEHCDYGELCEFRELLRAKRVVAI